MYELDSSLSAALRRRQMNFLALLCRLLYVKKIPLKLAALWRDYRRSGDAAKH